VLYTKTDWPTDRLTVGRNITLSGVVEASS
jgi:hypothetical protein